MGIDSKASVVLAGATGFVGRHVLAECRTRQINTLSVVRSKRKAIDLGIESWATFEGLTGKKLKAIGIDSPILINVVGSSRDEPNSSIWQAIVESTKTLTKIANDAGIRKVVYLSGYGITGNSSDHYFRAKAAAEEIIRACGIPYVIVKTSYILGPGDELTPSVLKALHGGRIEVPGDGSYRIQPIYVRDVAKILLNAAFDEMHNVDCNVLGPVMTYLQYVDTLAQRVAPSVVRDFVGLDIFLRRALLCACPALTTGELALLVSDLVGQVTGSCFGAEVRSVEEALNEWLPEAMALTTNKG